MLVEKHTIIGKEYFREHKLQYGLSSHICKPFYSELEPIRKSDMPWDVFSFPEPDKVGKVLFLGQ